MEWVDRLNYLDFVLLAIIGVSVVASLIRGFTRELAGLVSLVAGVLAGLWFHGAVAAFLMQYVSSPDIARMAAFGLIFLGVVIIGGFMGSMAAKAMELTGLSLFDRLAGAAFGSLKGVLFCAVILFALLAFTPAGPPAALNGSVTAPYVLSVANLLAALAPAEVKAAMARNAKVIEQNWKGGVSLPGTQEGGPAAPVQGAPASKERPAAGKRPSPR